LPAVAPAGTSASELSPTSALLLPPPWWQDLELLLPSSPPLAPPPSSRHHFAGGGSSRHWVPPIEGESPLHNLWAWLGGPGLLWTVGTERRALARAAARASRGFLPDAPVSHKLQLVKPPANHHRHPPTLGSVAHWHAQQQPQQPLVPMWAMCAMCPPPAVGLTTAPATASATAAAAALGITAPLLLVAGDVRGPVNHVDPREGVAAPSSGGGGARQRQREQPTGTGEQWRRQRRQFDPAARIAQQRRAAPHQGSRLFAGGCRLPPRRARGAGARVARRRRWPRRCWHGVRVGPLVHSGVFALLPPVFATA
jgi:hypothetical protein